MTEDLQTVLSCLGAPTQTNEQIAATTINAIKTVYLKLLVSTYYKDNKAMNTKYW